MARIRLDEAIVARGLLETRSRARAFILAGDIRLNGHPATRAGQNVLESDEITLAQKPRFVSRGGEKLAGALAVFDLDVAGMTVADLGASTGGFSDCLLQAGAVRVYAVDVGYGQIADPIRHDPRVITMERTNARTLEGLPEQVDLVTADVSFISLRLIFPTVIRILKQGGTMVPLIKPQFEAGRKDVGKKGVVRDVATHRQVLATVLTSAHEHGLRVEGLTRSSLLGPAGNVEFLALLRFDGPNASKDDTASNDMVRSRLIESVVPDAAGEPEVTIEPATPRMSDEHAE